ncbi:MAG: methyltransferase domain-containing protein [Candidatus Schekmanbacteria bacterium]|nr:methyltransferase domain-containing protein [Candidatus Schekmanbacteria bacterium]
MIADEQNPSTPAQAVFAERATTYVRSACHREPAVLRRIVAQAAPQKDWIALDIGTGTGHTAFALAPYVAAVIGVDVTPEMLAEARRVHGSEHTGAAVRFCLADAQDLPFPEGSFNLITCRRAAHHFPRVRRAVAEMARLLVDGGRLVIDDRSVPEDDFIDELMNELDTCHDRSHVRQYRPSEWYRLLSEQDFVVESVELYVRHRPLSALTLGVCDYDATLIRDRLEALDSFQRKRIRYELVDGEPHLNHWYVLVTAHL